MTTWLIGILIVLLCLAAVIVVLHIHDRIKLSKKIAELKTQGIPTRYAELEAYCKLPEGAPNAADIYIRAFKAYKPLPDAEKQELLPIMGKGPEPEEGRPYPPEQIAAAGELIELNREMFNLLHQAGQIESCYYPIDYSQKYPDYYDMFTDIKIVCYSLTIAQIYYRQTNQPQKAYEALLDQLLLAQSLSGVPSLANHLVRLVLLSMGVSRVNEMINESMPDGSRMRQLQDFLRQISRSWGLFRPLLGDICFYIEQSGFRRIDRIIGAPFFRHPVASLIMFILPKNLAGLLECYQKILEIDKQPVEKQLFGIRDVKKQVDGHWYRNMAANYVLPNVVQVFETAHLNCRVMMDCAATALAVERYRLKEGKLPETLDILAPEYLPGLSMNPFDGKPIRYKQTSPGYMIYTVCEEGADKEASEPGVYNWYKMRAKAQRYEFQVKR